MLELLKSGEFVRTLEADQSFEVKLENGDIIHVGAAQLGWSIEDYEITEHVKPELSAPKIEDLITQARFHVVSLADEVGNYAKTAHRGGVPYPQNEEANWPTKITEAKGIVAEVDNTKITREAFPIMFEAAGGDIDVIRAEAPKVIYYAAEFTRVSGAIQRIRESAEIEIIASSTSEEISAAIDRAKAAFAGLLGSGA